MQCQRHHNVEMLVEERKNKKPVQSVYSKWSFRSFVVDVTETKNRCDCVVLCAVK